MRSRVEVLQVSLNQQQAFVDDQPVNGGKDVFYDCALLEQAPRMKGPCLVGGVSSAGCLGRAPRLLAPGVLFGVGEAQRFNSSQIPLFLLGSVVHRTELTAFNSEAP